MNSLRILSFLSLVLSVELIGAPRTLAQSLVNLGNLGGDESNAFGINNSGEVIGSSDVNPGDGAPTAFIYADGTMTALYNEPSDAYGLNSSGAVVGDAPDGTGVRNAALFFGGSTTLLPGGPGTAYAINGSGVIVGENQQYGAFSYSNGTMTSLESGSSSVPLGINNSGQIVGVYGGTNGHPNAFIYSGGTVADLGTLGGLNSQANAINNSGQVVGKSDNASSDSVAFLYSSGSMTAIGSLGLGDSDALAINDAGTVVGWAGIGGADDAFVYSASTGMENLNNVYASLLTPQVSGTSGFLSLLEANGVNDSGQIVGYGFYWNGTTTTDEAFLLTPAPEPSVVMLCLSGLLALSGMICKRIRSGLILIGAVFVPPLRPIPATLSDDPYKVASGLCGSHH